MSSNVDVDVVVQEIPHDRLHVAGTGLSPSVDHDAARLDLVMQRYARGDTAAFSELYAAVAPRLHRLCMRLARRRDDAWDIFQEALMRLHRARASYIPGAMTLRWLVAIVYSSYLDHVRRERRHPQSGVESDAADSDVAIAGGRYGSSESELHARDLLAVLERELGRMSERNRRAYLLQCGDGLSISAVAAELGATRDVVRQRTHRAREQIRQALRDAGWEDVEGAD